LSPYIIHRLSASILSRRYISRYLNIYAGAFPDNLTFNQWHARRVEKVFPPKLLRGLSKVEWKSSLGGLHGKIKIFRYKKTVVQRGPSSFARAINANEKRRFSPLSFLLFFLLSPAPLALALTRKGFSTQRAFHNGSIAVNTAAGWAEYRYTEEVQGEVLSFVVPIPPPFSRAPPTLTRLFISLE